MNDTTLEKAERALRQFPRGTALEWTSDTWDFYAVALGDLTDAEISAAMAYAIRHCKFRPMPCELLDYARQITAERLAVSAQESYGIVVRERERAIRVGQDHPMYPNNPSIRAANSIADCRITDEAILQTVEAMGGWEAICREQCPSGVFRAHFVQFYQAVQRSLGDEDIQTLRLQYRTERRQALDAAEKSEIASGSPSLELVDSESERFVFSNPGMVLEEALRRAKASP